MLSKLRKSKPGALAILMVFAFSLIGVAPVRAEERRYPEVARLSFVSGGVTYSRGDDPDEWDDAVENVPLTVGDRMYAEDGRAEVQLSSGNFVRVAPRSYLSTLNLSDDVKQFYLGEGAAAFHIRRLPSNEVFEIDTPNVSVTFEEPGNYRVAVDENGDSRITVRRGRAVVAASGRQLTVENSEIRVYGLDAPRYEIVGLPATDAFDRWVAERNDRFDRAYNDAYRYASEDIVGVEDLAGYGRWEQIPDYGYAWTPTVVATSWAPFSNGRWYWQDPWGWSWISNDRWGWATSHYGRWMPYRSRWYWVPVRPRQRVRYAPACVEFVRMRDHVGWFPLHPRDRHVPWWERRDRRFDRNVVYVNRNYVTVVNHNTFINARPVNRYIVRDQVILRDARAAHFSEALPIPSRSSLRVAAEEGRRRGYRPSERVLNRVAVVRTAPPAPPRPFQDKLPEIQKNQGRAVEPARIFAVADDDRGARRVRVRPAAETDRGDFAPRNPNANTGPALQPVTAARGKKLATRDVRDNEPAAKPGALQKTPPVAQTPQPQAGGETQGREPERNRQQEKQAVEPRQEIERQKQVQQRQEERKAQPAKEQQEREPQAQEQKQQDFERRQTQQREEPQKARAEKERARERQPAQPSREQLRLEELERQQREREHKAQAQQNRQEQERREQAKQRQQQERQAQQQKQQEAQRREQAIQQQEQARREQQLRQQQAQERQARDLQRQQQEIERRQQQQERPVPSQPREQQAREQQIRQQQQQAQREAQQLLRQQEQQDRRPQPPRRPPQPQELPAPQQPPALR